MVPAAIPAAHALTTLEHGRNPHLMSGVSQQTLDEAVQARKARKERFCETSYIRFSDDWQRTPRGTAVFDGGTVYGYPSIGRILALEVGLREQFDGPIWAEEKVDGYNVRVFRHGKETLALTRGGFICPFTTDRLPDFLDLSLFDNHPDIVLCAEVAGPDNPYLEGCPPYVHDDVRFFVFDAMRLDTPGFLDQSEKLELMRRYRLPAVEIFGRFEPDSVDPIREILRDLNESGREGLVFKRDVPDGKRAKYVTGASDIQDIRAMSDVLLEVPPEYFTNRLLRLALYLEEHGEYSGTELDRKVGAALLGGLRDAISGARREGRVIHSFRCRFNSRERAQQFIQQLKRMQGKQVNVANAEINQEGGYWVLTFEKIFQRMSETLAHHLEGGSQCD